MAADAVVATVVREVVTERLTAATARTTTLPTAMLARLRVLEGVLGISVVEAIVATTTRGRGAIDEVLCRGARVCFTGSAVDADGRIWERDRMNAAAAARGLAPVPSVTKKRSDALVVAEVGTQSDKARKAKELDKLVFSPEDFFAWLGTAE
ncbi:hypothetical protein [Cellulomonas iranensis]|uniref:hypothetical protein n=1 Tax=Cellulomonas iranensis TaxID=76862 RepID=UPI003D7E8421